LLQDKYRALITAAANQGVSGFSAREQEGVLYIDGMAPSASVKDSLWDIYEAIDPNYASRDLMMNLNVAKMAPGARAKVVTQSSNLNIRKEPSTTAGIVGKAKHRGYVTLIAKTDDLWWQIRTD
jgi:uncharacterized protein YgiM (DUF1202 family)